MRTWVNGELLTDPDAPAVGARDHGLTVGDGVFEVLKVVDGRPFALDLHLARLTPVGARSRAAGARPRRGTPRRWRRCSEGEPLTLGRRPDHLDRWPGTARARDRGDGPPSLVVVAAPMDPVARHDRGRHRAVAAQRARGAGRPQDHVVRRERARPGPGPRARGQRGGLRQPPGPPVRGHRHQRLLRRRRRAADARRWPAAAWPGSPAAWSSTGTARPRSTSRSRCWPSASEVFLASTTRDVQADPPLGRPRARRPPARSRPRCRKAWHEHEAELLGADP